MALTERTREVYNRLTAMFTETGFKYADAPSAYSELTAARCMLEGGWDAGDAMFVDRLLGSLELFVKEAVSRRGKATGNPTVQQEELR